VSIYWRVGLKKISKDVIFGLKTKAVRKKVRKFEGGRCRGGGWWWRESGVDIIERDERKDKGKLSWLPWNDVSPVSLLSNRYYLPWPLI
jgi:hypothetical protein